MDIVKKRAVYKIISQNTASEKIIKGQVPCWRATQQAESASWHCLQHPKPRPSFEDFVSKDLKKKKKKGKNLILAFFISATPKTKPWRALWI